MFADIFSALGANPTQMSWADAQPALRQRRGRRRRRTRCSLFTAAKMHTVGQKFVTTWGYVADPLVFVVNKDDLGSLDPGRPGDRARRPRSTPASRRSRWPARGWSRPTSRC